MDPQSDGTKKITIRCTQCQSEYMIHMPGVLRLVHPAISQITVFSVCAIDERFCPKCKALHVPIFGDLRLNWVRGEEPESANRIVVPNLVLPPGTLPPRG